jgi:MFS family permease
MQTKGRSDMVEMIWKHMLSPLRHPAYARLFSAQVVALLGTGLATVALGLLAHEIAGVNAGEILGAMLALKMIAYVAVAPIASALAAHAPRKTLLIALDLVRAVVVAWLPFVSEPWQIYALMTLLYVASASFTPSFQAMIPDILPNEQDYTKALSLSRLAADLESVASPVLAALLLSVWSFHELFAGTALGFVASALFVLAATIPAFKSAVSRPFMRRLTVGLTLFLGTPRLRGLVALSLASAAGGAMAFVNTVVLVQSNLGLNQQTTAWALAAFGLGSMIASASLPPLLDRFPDRLVMLTGALVMAVLLALGPLLIRDYPSLVATWILLGAGYSTTLTPVGRVLRRSSPAEDRPALFAAHFALSHACWLVAYPVAGFAGASLGINFAFLALASLCFVGAIGAALVWPARDSANCS